MQKLQFETAWDKTISQQDRQTIMKIFEQTKNKTNRCLEISYLWEACNHQGNLLITALIHNYDSKPLQLTNTIIAYVENHHCVANGIFSINLLITPKTTMPWTFIFSNENITDVASKFSIHNV